MGSTGEFVLSVIRAHPGGISTMEIVAYGRSKSNVYRAASRLEKFGLVTHETVLTKGKSKITVWRPVYDS